MSKRPGAKAQGLGECFTIPSRNPTPAMVVTKPASDEGPLLESLGQAACGQR